MVICNWKKYALNFIDPGGTSRGVLHIKNTWILIMYDNSDKGKKAYAECGMFEGLSYDDRPGFEEKLTEICKRIPLEGKNVLSELIAWPSIYFGVEMLLKDWENGANRILFESEFSKGNQGIPINGLIWMGSKDYMLQQIKQKLKDGFTCLKMKIGAIDFETEISILSYIRQEFNSGEIELRVDANGAFSVEEAPAKLYRLSKLDIHSIEQPIKAGQFQEMAGLVESSPVPIALDEELIGVTDLNDKIKLIETIKPRYIILKPSLIGGYKGSAEWIDLITKNSGNWWITSALESNIGLNAISQFVFLEGNPLPQGLGTGKLFSNNFDSPLLVSEGKLYYDSSLNWNFNNLKN